MEKLSWNSISAGFLPRREVPLGFKRKYYNTREFVLFKNVININMRTIYIPTQN